MTHRGEILKKVMEDTKTTVTEIADLLSVSRHTVYRYCEDPMTDIDVLMTVSKFIKVDILAMLPEFKREPPPSDQDNLEYKFKFMDMAEKVVKLMEENQELKKKLKK